MPKLSNDRNPKHTRHASGQGRVTLSGETFYTGVWGDGVEPTNDCVREYLRLVGLWNANGRRRLNLGQRGLTVGQLCDQYAEWAMDRFVKRGKPTGYNESIRAAILLAKATHADTPVDEFTPKAFSAMRLAWLRKEKGRRARSTVNAYGKRIVEAFRWGVADERVHPDVHARIKAVALLSIRDTKVPDPPRRMSAPTASVEFCLANMGTPGRDIIRLMLASGIRPSEACCLNVKDLDRSESPWTYRVSPDYNKAEHRGRSRVVYLGPKAQAVLLPYLAIADKSRHGWVFTPSKGPGNHGRPYRAKALHSVIQSMCRNHGLEPFSPNQLRHSALSGIYAKLGIKAAQSVGGHSDSRTTMIYVDPDVASADERKAARDAAMATG